jgi:vanillate O-demethylase monooxygenase subunit
MTTFIRNRWYPGAWSHELAPSPQGIKPIGRKILGEDIAFYRTATGKAVALASSCPHRYAPLEYGDIIGENLKCRYHGLQFAPDGKCAVDPGSDKPPAMRVKSYPIDEKDGMIFIWIGDDKPTEAAPDYLKYDEGYGGIGCGYLTVKSNYLIMIDNLCDDAHATHLHEMLATEGHVARPKNTITNDGSMASCITNIYDTTCVPFFRSFLKTEGNVDQRIVQAWYDPIYCRVKVGVIETGGDLEKRLGTDNLHMLVPETETTCHYFWSLARNAQLEDHALTEKLTKMLGHIFKTEDAWMAEGQQRNIGNEDMLNLNLSLLPQDKYAAIVKRNIHKVLMSQSAETVSVK